MAVTRDGIPVRCWTFPGNTAANLARNDSTTSACTATTTSWPTESQIEWLFLGEPLAHGAEAADMLVVVPVEQMPLTEQGKPDRPAIRRLGVLAAA